MVEGVLRKSGKDVSGAAAEEALSITLEDGLIVRPLYRPRDTALDTGYPGFAPYVRGGRPEGSGADGWDVRQRHARPEPEHTNEAVLADLEEVYGRHSGQIRTISGVYRDEAGPSSGVGRTRDLVAEFERAEGRRPRILVAKMGQDGHDRGQKVIATAFADLGFDVDVGPLFQTPAEVARQAVEADVHIVGVSSLAAGHLTLVPALREALAAEGREDITVVVGGVIPPQDVQTLRDMGAAAVFPPGTVIPDAAYDLVRDLARALGHER
ncbi:methylmalonyl-CoA mutase family protein [Streptomyces sp. NPDC059080]|uniref:methylmalonyl-CoA mutase family protein n=1 Tax=Streptomyces sp. NPDC059080 TaxID=3346718 RepID=UPI003694447E